jgi:Ca2+-binding EF-hand superfamily protein
MRDQGRGVSDADLDKFIKQADENGDGKIQKRELYALYKNLNRPPKKH